MLNKNRFLFVFTFLCFTSTICKAKDSTFVFKLALGVNCSYWISNDLHYKEIWQGKYYIVDIDSSYSQNKYISPVASIGFRKRINKNVSFFMNEKYNYSNVEYLHYQKSGGLSPPTWTYSYQKINHSFFAHQFTSSIGFEFEIRHFYFAPKIDLAYSYFAETIVSTTTYSYKNEINTQERKSKRNFFSYGMGANLGYNFKIKTHPLFIEYQIDFHTLKDFQQYDFLKTPAKLKQLNNSLMLGIRF